MPVYIPDFAPFAPAPNISAVPSGAVQGISGGGALGQLAASGAQGVRERQTLEQLAGSVSNPEVAEILRSQKAAVPLFGTPGSSSGGGRGSRSGGSGVSGDAINFALQTIRDQDLHEKTMDRDRLRFQHSTALEGIRFGNRMEVARFEDEQYDEREQMRQDRADERVQTEFDLRLRELQERTKNAAIVATTAHEREQANMFLNHSLYAARDRLQKSLESGGDPSFVTDPGSNRAAMDSMVYIMENGGEVTPEDVMFPHQAVVRARKMYGAAAAGAGTLGDATPKIMNDELDRLKSIGQGAE